MEDCLVIIDSGFLSKLSKYLGGGKHLVYDIIKFSKNLSTKQILNCKKIFYVTAPPFQGTPPTKDESNRKIKYDKFIYKLKKNSMIKVEEGRVQKIKESDRNIIYSQKGVDTLLIMRLSFVPIDFHNIKKIILVSSDTDFCPVIEELKLKGIDVILYSYHEKIRDAKFSISNHLIKCCSKYIRLSKEDFNNAPLIKEIKQSSEKEVENGNKK